MALPAWESWNSGISATSTLTTALDSIQVKSYVWENWNSLISAGTMNVQVVRAPAPQSAADIAAREQAREAAEQRRQRQLRAADRALGLLMSLLDEEQQASYRDRGYFDLTGSRGRRWRIEKQGQAGNVLLLPDNPAETEAQAYCCHPPDSLPLADAHLAQALHLVTDEDDFERTANRSGRRHLQAVA